MKELIRPVPIEIVDLGIETHAQIEIEEILLTSFPPIQKTILKFSTECTVFDLRTEYSIKIKNDDAVIKCYRGNTLNTFIQKDAGERTVAEWRKVISRSKNTPDIVKAIDSIKVSDEDVIFEDYVLFYNPAKSRFDEEDYLVTIPYEPKKGLSREFLAYFAETLNEVATEGLSDLMDFLSDDGPEEFGLVWDKEAFDKGKAQLEEKVFFAYPRY